MRVTGRVGAWVMGLALCGACGKVASNRAGGDPGASGASGASDGPVHTASAPVARADFPAALAKLICAGFADCCDDQMTPVDVATCESQVTHVYEPAYANSADSTYDAAVAADCLQAYPAIIHCGVTRAAVPLPKACQRMLVGHAKPGEACNVSGECQGSETGAVVCDVGSPPENGPGTGTCTAATHGKRGEQCRGSCSQLWCRGGSSVDVGATESAHTFCFEQDELYCDGTSQQCAAPVATGKVCDSDDVCEDGGYCEDDHCHALLADGAACQAPETCRSGACVSGVCAELMPTPAECAKGSPFE